MFTGAVQVTEVRMRARLVSIFVKIVQLRIQLKSRLKMDQHAFADFKEQITAVGDDKSRLRLFKTW